MKADPFAFHAEVRPNTASKVWELGGYEWHDSSYMKRRLKKNILKDAVSIYEEMCIRDRRIDSSLVWNGVFIWLQANIRR